MNIRVLSKLIQISDSTRLEERSMINGGTIALNTNNGKEINSVYIVKERKIQQKSCINVLHGCSSNAFIKRASN